MITTTLNKIRAANPCTSGWGKLLRHLGKTKPDDEPLPLSVIVESNGLDDALWCCRTLPEYDREWRLFAVWCARQVQPLMTDPRSIAALDVAERFTAGDATAAELRVARAAAWYAAQAAAGDAAGDAAWYAARDAAWYAAQAAWYAAQAAAGDAAGDAAWYAAQAAAGDAARDAQRDQFLKICGGAL